MGRKSKTRSSKSKDMNELNKGEVILDSKPVVSEIQPQVQIAQMQHQSLGKFRGYTFSGQPSWLSWMHVQLVIRRLWLRPLPGQQHSFLETDHKIFYIVILSLPLIQEGQLSVSGERISTILVNRLED